MSEFILREWSVVDLNTDPYMAPELRRRSLSGRISGHPSFSDGTIVTTSSIIGSEGRRVRTSSGSTYILEGPPAEGYAKYLAENNRTLDESQPVKIIG
jgi:hypothetical protein